VLRVVLDEVFAPGLGLGSPSLPMNSQAMASASRLAGVFALGIALTNDSSPARHFSCVALISGAVLALASAIPFSARSKRKAAYGPTVLRCRRRTPLFRLLEPLVSGAVVLAGLGRRFEAVDQQPRQPACCSGLSFATICSMLAARLP